MADQRSDNSLTMREAARLLRASDAKGNGEDFEDEITAITEVPLPPARPHQESASEVDPKDLHPLARNARGLVEAVPPSQRIWALLLIVVGSAVAYVLYQTL